MKIYSMTATFGKLENQTLTLKPGLNVIHAPNEWGKSTWCAFLVNMLYGMETRVKSTKTVLADKERYAPWSGAPMSGRMDLEWRGQNITIERWTKGRTPMGEFRAYETESGVEVPELTASTCGQMLLGVERSVFLRSGFLRLSDLPVTEDDALRRRLNSLVTTGDESGTADVLAQKLKDLKNKIRYNRSGLLPQAEQQRAELAENLGRIRAHEETARRLDAQREALRQRKAALENHRQTLRYEEGEKLRSQMAQARLTLNGAEAALKRQQARCSQLPGEGETQQAIEKLRQLNQQSMALNLEQQMLPAAPQKPEIPPAFQGMTPEEAIQQAKNDRHRSEEAQTKRKRHLAALLGVLAVSLMLMLAFVFLLPLGAVAAAAGSLLIWILWLLERKREKEEAAQFAARYPGIPCADWVSYAEVYARRMREFQQEQGRYEQKVGAFREKREALIGEIRAVTQGQPMDVCLQAWEETSAQWTLLRQTQAQADNARREAEMLTNLAHPVEKPALPDELTLSMEQTMGELENLERQKQLLDHQFGQNQGLMEALGQPEALLYKLQQVDARLERLRNTYAALELAQSALADAAAELQRRFAPRISREAQRMFAQMTHDRYDRLTLSQDLSLNAAAGAEGVLRSTLWRSEGTVDQMYLALRLAVSRELSPHAPLILDDALVRFDDERHAAAMEILQSEGKNRQILLFTCQTRELSYQ